MRDDMTKEIQDEYSNKIGNANISLPGNSD